jgi:ribosome biogenesis GTPase
MILEDYGWDSWFDDQYKSLNMHLTIGRVVGNSEIYKIVCEEGLIDARISDRLIYSTSSDSELPVPGDWVLIISDGSDSGYSIYDLLPRRSFLTLPDDDDPEEQIPAAANVDYILAAIPAGDDHNPSVAANLIDVSREWGAEPMFLCYGDSSGKNIKDNFSKTAGDAAVIYIDSIDETGLTKLNGALTPRKTYAVTGVNSDDVSAIISFLTDGEVSGMPESNGNNGVLRVLPSSAILLGVPLPGDAGLLTGNSSVEDGEDFGDIIEIASQCRFNDCRHINEPGCAILEAIDNGELDYDYYRAFMKALKKESGRVVPVEAAEAKKQKKGAAVRVEKVVGE